MASALCILFNVATNNVANAEMSPASLEWRVSEKDYKRSFLVWIGRKVK